MKWDEMRAICHLAGERVELFSRAPGSGST
jgi:ATP-dependent DNA ligase